MKETSSISKRDALWSSDSPRHFWNDNHIKFWIFFKISKITVIPTRYANGSLIERKSFLKDRLKVTSCLGICLLSPSCFPQGLHYSILTFPLLLEVKTVHINKPKISRKYWWLHRQGTCRWINPCWAVTLKCLVGSQPSQFMLHPPWTRKFIENASRWMLNKTLWYIC